MRDMFGAEIIALDEYLHRFFLNVGSLRPCATSRIVLLDFWHLGIPVSTGEEKHFAPALLCIFFRDPRYNCTSDSIKLGIFSGVREVDQLNDHWYPNHGYNSLAIPQLYNSVAGSNSSVTEWNKFP